MTCSPDQALNSIFDLVVSVKPVQMLLDELVGAPPAGYQRVPRGVSERDAHSSFFVNSAILSSSILILTFSFGFLVCSSPELG